LSGSDEKGKVHIEHSDFTMEQAGITARRQTTPTPMHLTPEPCPYHGMNGREGGELEEGL